MSSRRPYYPQNFSSFIGFDVFSPTQWRGPHSRDFQFFSQPHPGELYPKDATFARSGNSIIPRASYSSFAVHNDLQDHGFVPIRAFLTFAFLQEMEKNEEIAEHSNEPHIRMLESILEAELYFEMLAGDALVCSMPLDVPFSSLHPPYNILMHSIDADTFHNPRFKNIVLQTLKRQFYSEPELHSIRTYNFGMAVPAKNSENPHQTLLENYIRIHPTLASHNLQEGHSLVSADDEEREQPDIPLSLFALPASSAILWSYPPIFSMVSSSPQSNVIGKGQIFSRQGHPITQADPIACGNKNWLDLEDSRYRICFLSFPIPIQRRFIIPPYQGGDHRLKAMNVIPAGSALSDMLKNQTGEICLSIQYEVVHNAFREPALLSRHLESLPNMEIPLPYWKK